MTNVFGEARLNDVTAVAWSDIWRRWFLRRRFKLILIHIELHSHTRRLVASNSRSDRPTKTTFLEGKEREVSWTYRFITVLISRTQREITLWLLRDAETPPTSSATFPNFRTTFQKIPQFLLELEMQSLMRKRKKGLFAEWWRKLDLRVLASQ